MGHSLNMANSLARALLFFVLALSPIARAQPTAVQPDAPSDIVDRFHRGRAVLNRAVEAAGGATALRGIAGIRFRAEGSIWNDLQARTPDWIGRSHRDGPYRLETGVEFANGCFFQRTTQVSRGGYGLDATIIYRDGTLYLLRHHGRDYTETPNATPPMGPGSAGAFNMRLVPAILLQRALQNFRSTSWVAEANVAGAPADVVDFSFDESTRLRLYVTRTDRRVRRVDAIAADAIVGDDVIYNLFEGDQKVGGIWFPARVIVHRRGVRALDLTLGDIALGPLPETALAIPPGYKLRTDDDLLTTNVTGRLYEVRGLGGGLFRIQFAVMEDFIVAYEAGINYQTAQTAINEMQRIAPNKPIRYAIMSHFHNDHAGGVGAYVDAGATILASPHERDTLASYARRRSQFQGLDPLRDENFRFEPVGHEGREIVDAAGRRLQVLSLSASPHVSRILTLYDPDTRALITADLYSPLVRYNETFASFGRWLRRNVPPVDTVLGSHHDPASRAEILEAERAYRRVSGSETAP